MSSCYRETFRELYAGEETAHAAQTAAEAILARCDELERLGAPEEAL